MHTTKITAEFNDWEHEKIVQKNKILNFEFLKNNNFIEEIENEYYYLNTNLEKVEESFYKSKNEQLAKKLGIENVEKELKNFIDKLNLYNEIKDIGQSILGKIAEMKGMSVRQLHEDFDVLEEL